MKQIINDVSIVSIVELIDIEQSLLSTMLLSYNKYILIKKELVNNDFTFEIHSIIYKALCNAEKKFIDISNNDSFAIDQLDDLLSTITELLDDYGNIEQEYSLRILSSNPSLNIQEDINILKFFSEEKNMAINNHKNESTPFLFNFEDSKNFTSAKFIQNKLISIYTDNIFSLPTELEGSVSETIQNISELNLKDEEIEVTFSPVEDETVGFAIFNITKDVTFINSISNKFQILFDWANKYKLSEESFPREIEKLRDLKFLDISNKNIKELPKEIYLLKSLRFLDVSFNEIDEIAEEIMQLNKLIFICFKSNNIKKIPKGIEELKKVSHLCFCNNEITELPDSFFNLSKLNSFCIHGNKLKDIPERISSIRNLETLSISNNYISKIPQSIALMKKLKSFQFENNYIKEIKMDVLKLPNLNELAFDDELLEVISKNIDLLGNIKTINLLESRLNLESELIRKLSLNFEWDEWMDTEDKRENGCVKLSNVKDESNEN